MKKTGKVLFWIISVLFAVVLIVGIVAYANFGDLARKAAERAGTQATGTHTNLGSLDISLEQKTAVANSLSFTNMKGYNGGDIIRADKITVTLESATRELVVLENIDIEGVTVHLNQFGDKNNLIALRDQIQALKGDKPESTHPVKVIVRTLTIGESTLDPYVKGLPQQMDPIKIPPVRVTGIGARENGVVAKEAVAQVLSKYLQQAQSSAVQGNVIERDLGKIIGDTLEEKKEDVRRLFGR